MGLNSGVRNLERNILNLDGIHHIFDTTHRKSGESKNNQYHSYFCQNLLTFRTLRSCFQQLGSGHGGVLSGHGGVLSGHGPVVSYCLD
ncbi:hypothetical protein Hanom_Chr02g00134921 [Helianthus anomalus]